MEVHVGKCCYDNPMCGLCDAKFEKLDSLETHLTTCEIYECGECGERCIHLSDMKVHIKETHEDSDFLYHMKMKRENMKIVDFTKYFLSQILLLDNKWEKILDKTNIVF